MNVERSGGVGAKSNVKRMAKRKLAGEAHHDVPGLARIGEIEDQDQRRRHQGDEQDREPQPCPPRYLVQEQRPHDARLPRMPCGRNSSTTTRIAKANMLFADGVNRRPASASVMPISTPPSSAPGIEPSPPVMTMTKASSVYCGPSGGVTSTMSVSIEPAAPT